MTSFQVSTCKYLEYIHKQFLIKKQIRYALPRIPSVTLYQVLVYNIPTTSLPPAGRKRQYLEDMGPQVNNCPYGTTESGPSAASIVIANEHWIKQN